MDSPPVSFGRRGLEHHDDTWSAPPQGVARTAHSGDRAAPVPPGRMPVAPDEVVGRSLAKVVSFAAFLWLVMMLTAGQTKYGHELPYWLRSPPEVTLQHFAFPLFYCALITLVLVCPIIRRPVALKFYEDHLDYCPLVGAIRRVPWSQVGEITKSSWLWSRNRCVYIAVAGERRIVLSSGSLWMGRDALVDLLESRRRAAGRRTWHLSGEPIAGQYLFPGH